MISSARDAALRLLLENPARLDPADVDWSELRAVAVSTGVVVRLADALRAGGHTLPARFAEAAARACAAAQHSLELVDRLGARCDALGLPHTFLHTAQQYPDGSHITLLLAAPNTLAVDGPILSALPAVRRPKTRGFQRWLGGASNYALAYGTSLRIRHGRLGRFGEHARYARLMVDRSRRTAVGPTTCQAPTAEDHLILMAVERAYSQPASGVGDCAWAFPLLRAGAFDWDYVFATALSIGMLVGVGAYLAHVNRIHRHLFGADAVAPGVLARFETARTPRHAYVRHIGATIDSGRWQSAARLTLVPLVAGLARVRRPQ